MLFGRKKRLITRLIVVEDEPLVAFDNEHFLREAGFDVVATLDTVAEAIQAVDSGVEIDLLLVDVRLADGSGVAVAEAANRRKLPVLFVTGNCPVEARQLAMGCLAKPYQQRDLLLAIDAIEAVIDGTEPKRLPSGFTLFQQAA